MKRILLIGNSPLPDENAISRPAAGLRTFQFLKPLSSGAVNIRNNVKLISIAMPECYEEAPEEKEIESLENFSHIVISKNNPNLFKRIQEIHDEFEPEVIIGVNTYPSYAASKIKSNAPFWADLNGWIMAEGQAQASKLGSNDYLSHYYKMEKNILMKADKLSAVSEAQMYALIGELSSLGRLNKETFDWDFVHHIPNGTVWFEGEGRFEEEKASDSEAMQTLEKIPDGKFILLWMGGYNTWVDEDTLYKGVEEAMKKCEKLYFVSTGGKIKGLNNKTFENFKGMIENSKFKDRFVFLGWVDTKDIPYIYRRADCGINVDLICTETLTGARNRINEMMKFSLPVVTTLGSEISYEVEKVGAGIGVESGNSEKLAEGILTIYKVWEDYKNSVDDRFLTYGDNGNRYIEQECNYEKVVGPVLEWLEDPKPAPDRGMRINLEGGSFRGGLRYIKENGLRKFLKKLFQKIKK